MSLANPSCTKKYNSDIELYKMAIRFFPSIILLFFLTIRISSKSDKTQRFSVIRELLVKGYFAAEILKKQQHTFVFGINNNVIPGFINIGKQKQGKGHINHIYPHLQVFINLLRNFLTFFLRL